MIGVGVDLVKISRIERALAMSGERFARRILSTAEYNTYVELGSSAAKQAIFLAKRFAVKEAVSKALGTGLAQGVSWHDIELSHDKLGKPEVLLQGGALKRFEFLEASVAHVSLADEAGLVTAYAHIA